MYYTSGNIALTLDQKTRIRDSWALITPLQETAAHLFYYHLFRYSPELRPLFCGNMKDQGDKFLTVVDLAVRHLEEIDSFAARLKIAGKAHRRYGVTLADYKKVKTSLLWTLEASLAEKFSTETRNAWAECYNLLSFAMIEGAEYGKVQSEPEPQTSNWFQTLLGTN